ncbi:MAG: serine/threonine protein kinase [Nodularia sp. (in: Bacteria)]|nr:MAG: serine/threonine protein kinase [Nodularia sp. (in: cyanobacteria)]
MIGHILRRRYKIIKELGLGGFGETYLAEWPQDLPVTPKYKCVIKRLIKPSTPELDTEERFKKEAATLFKLGKEHPQIPELYDFFEENREFYLVQEFIEGHDLSNEIVSGEPWSEADIIQLLQEILEVLAFVHENNVIHRDIKPLNLMRRYPDNKLVLIDFGIVKEISNLSLNAQGEISSTISIGTRGYMPSEQYHGHPKLCSDIYALGITAIQALTGVSPHELRIDSDTLEVLWIEQAQASNALVEILTKMVRYSSQQRYSDAGEALQALKQAGLLSLSLAISPRPIKIGDQYGYIDLTGRIIIQPQFDLAGEFSEGLAAVNFGAQKSLFSLKKGGKWGYIDMSGQLVIPPQFDAAEKFSEGLTLVQTGEKFDYINKSGQIIIQSEFDEAWGFKEGLALVQMGDKLGYIGKSGQIVIQPQFDEAEYFFEGLAVVCINEKYGYINKAGHLVIQIQFDYAGNFCEGLAVIRIGDQANGQCAYIDKTGQIILQPQCGLAVEFSEGFAGIKIDKKWGFINKSGQLVIQPKFYSPGRFYGGIAKVFVGGQERYIDKMGKFIY